MEINKHNQDANRLSQLLFDETFKKSNNPQKPYTTYTGDSTETFTPRETAEKMVEMLDDLDKWADNKIINDEEPGSIWNDKTTFLDPQCKTGVFLKVIFDKLDTALQNESIYGDKYKDDVTRRNHILNNQLFGLALDNEQSLVASRRNVSGRWDYKNIQYIDKYIQKVVNKDERKKLKDMIKESLGVNMFDVVIGNPPYQHSNGGGQRGNGATDIFDKFIIYGIEISKHCCAMITPSKWINKQQLKEVREIMSTGHIQTLVTVKSQSDIFNNADIAGGVSYWCYDKMHKHGQCLVKNFTNNLAEIHGWQDTSWSIRPLTLDYEIIADNCGYRVISKTKSDNILKIAGGVDTFGVTKQVGQLKHDSMHTFALQRFKYDDFQTVEWFNASELKNAELADKFKVITGMMNPDRGGVNNSISWNVLNRPRILNKVQLSRQNDIVLYVSDSFDEVNAFYKYILSKFTRFLILQGVGGVHMNQPKVYKYVPLQDFTSNSDINWDKPVSEIDHQLYKKYNLSDDEIEYIEKTIKPMI